MKNSIHRINHQYQPTNTSCSPTALSMLLEYYDLKIVPFDIEARVPQCVDEDGKKIGTINQNLATWCLGKGFNVNLYTFDCQIIDQSWSKLSKDSQIERLLLRKNGWVVPSLGKEWTEQYSQSYVDFLVAGGQLHIKQNVTTKLLYGLLSEGPFLPCVNFNTLYGAIRSLIVNDDEVINDDINGESTNHSIVVYGYDAQGNFLIADPWEKPGLHKIDPERLIASISTAQTECDNLLFQISKK